MNLSMILNSKNIFLLVSSEKKLEVLNQAKTDLTFPCMESCLLTTTSEAFVVEKFITWHTLLRIFRTGFLRWGHSKSIFVQNLPFLTPFPLFRSISRPFLSFVADSRNSWVQSSPLNLINVSSVEWLLALNFMSTMREQRSSRETESRKLTLFIVVI